MAEDLEGIPPITQPIREHHRLIDPGTQERPTRISFNLKELLVAVEGILLPIVVTSN